MAILRNSLSHAFVAQRIECAAEQYFEQFDGFSTVGAWLRRWELVLNPGLREQATEPRVGKSTDWKQALKRFREAFDESLRWPAKGAESQAEEPHEPFAGIAMVSVRQHGTSLRLGRCQKNVRDASKMYQPFAIIAR